MSQIKYKTALTIAGSDCSGGAGIQADLKTFSALKVYGMSVLTALTSQNTCEVKSIFEVSPQFVGEQIDSIFEDISVDAVKIGMLGKTSIIKTVADRIKKFKPKFVVLDPVMVSKSGALLLQKSAVLSLKQVLFPLATVITPNLPEASSLLEREIHSQVEMEKAATDLLKYGSYAVLLKGGHSSFSDKCSDCFVTQDAPSDHLWIEYPRIQTKNTHGTGCTLSAAIAAFLARGMALESAIVHAKNYLSCALFEGAKYSLGKGHGPVLH